MRNYVIFPLLLIFCCFFTASAEVPKIRYEREAGRPTVQSTGIWEKIASAGVSNNAKTPMGMLAYAVAENNYIFNWVPSNDAARITGQADIMDAVLSQDESLLIIAERIGGANQNNSTRLVFVNLQNNKICGGFEIPERRIVKLFNLPGQSGRILALQEGQSVFQNSNAFLNIDLRRKRVRQIGADITENISEICTDGNKVWYASGKRNRICEIDFDEPFKPRYCDTKKAVSKLCYNQAFKSVIAFENGICEFFTVTGNGLFLDTSVKLPENYEADWCMAGPPQSNSAIVMDKNGNGLFVTSGGVMPLSGRLEPYGCVLPDGTILIGMVARSPRINNIVLPGGEIKRYFSPSNLQPTTRNRTLAIYSRTAEIPEIILLDDRANVFKIVLTSRSGRKSPVLIVNKTGMR